jgi:ATP-dependent DNA helicase DinG
MLGRGGTQAIERFKKSSNGVLLAAGAIWEGIDIPGDTLSMLIIVKLPFAVPDPIGDYERSLCGGMERYRETALIPDMLVKGKQGYGRLIRTEKDTGCVAFFDARMREGKPLRERVLRSLPLCGVTSSVTAVSRFYQDIKPDGYFG